MKKSVSVKVEQLAIPTYKEGEEVLEPILPKTAFPANERNPYPNRLCPIPTEAKI